MDPKDLPRYRVETVKDIAKIPADRLAAFMDEFPALIEMQQQTNDQLKIYPKAVRKLIRMVKLWKPMYWYDEGKTKQKAERYGF
jgi:hypothetical protein